MSCRSGIVFLGALPPSWSWHHAPEVLANSVLYGSGYSSTQLQLLDLGRRVVSVSRQQRIGVHQGIRTDDEVSYHVLPGLDTGSAPAAWCLSSNVLYQRLPSVALHCGHGSVAGPWPDALASALARSHRGRLPSRPTTANRYAGSFATRNAGCWSRQACFPGKGKCSARTAGRRGNGSPPTAQTSRGRPLSQAWTARYPRDRSPGPPGDTTANSSQRVKHRG